MKWKNGKWWVKATEERFGFFIGEVPLSGVHPRRACKADGFPCVVHAPSEHHMRDFPLLWRGDRRLFERTCPHNVGHPDPDDLAFHVRNGNAWQANHGCDGCCRPPGEGHATTS